MELRAERTLPPLVPVRVASHSSAVLKLRTFLRMVWASDWESRAMFSDVKMC
jgi:hypothetical protein